jgi:hypothetical protein
MKCIVALIALVALTSLHAAEGKPLKIFILAGQSHMDGHAKIETFDYIGDDPATALLLKEMCGADGKQPKAFRAVMAAPAALPESTGDGGVISVLYTK